MKIIANVAVLAFLVLGCELIEVGSRQNKGKIELNQNSPLGAIYLFKAELDNDNSMGAIQILRRDGGEQFLAVERIEIIDDLNRLKRTLQQEKVTFIEKDSLSPEKWKYTIEFDYHKKVAFTASKINNKWFITKISDS
jgi:hypothetical protein